MAKGRIKDFKAERGGHIVAAKGGEEVFFPVSAIKTGKESIRLGALVEFEIGPSRSGKPQACSVTVLSEGRGPTAAAPQQKPPGKQGRGLPEECVFESFLEAPTGEGKPRPKMAVFKGPPETAAEAMQQAGLKATQFRQFYGAFQLLAGALRDRRIEFADARVRMGHFYTERIVRQANRGVLPPVAKELFDRHWDLALSSPEEMIGFFAYVKSIYCYFEDKGDR